MESTSIPSTPMLTVELKGSIPVDFQGALKRHILDQYGEDPDNYGDEIAQLNQLREAAVTPARDYSGCRTLRRYFCQLRFLEARFPLHEGGAASMPFSWTDTFSGKSVSVSDIAYEQASILFNLGCLHSQLGDYDDRTTDEGMRVSCTHFQCAAGAFDHVKEHFASVSSTPDLGSEMMAFLTSLMLGQAQECMLEKAMHDGKKGNITSRLAWQVSNYYSTSLLLTESQTIEKVVGKRAKSWQKHCKAKMLYFMSLAQMFASTASAGQNKGGERVAYLKLASSNIADALKLVKDEPKMKEPLSVAADSISKSLDQSIKDNDFVYHDRIPDPSEIPEIQGTSIVKPIPLQANDPSVSGADIFAKLVPMTAHEASSVYSEEKAKMLRQVVSLVEGKNEELRKAMVSFNLDDLTQPFEQEKSLPGELETVYSDMKGKGAALKKIKESLTELETVAEKVKSCLDRIDGLLKEDESQEQLVQEKLGPHATSNVATEIRTEWKQYMDTYTKGAQTNADVKQKFNQNSRFFELLTGTAEGLLASLPSRSLLDTPIDEEVVENLQKLLSKVDQMKQQRATMLENFKQKLKKDDITNRIVTHEGEAKEDFFAHELDKHQENVALIRQNLEAQDRIIAALTEANAKYASTRRAMQDVELQRKETVQAMVEAAGLFDSLEARASKGLAFFTQLDEKISQVVSRCEDFCATRKRERPSLEPATPNPLPQHSTPSGGIAGPSRASLPPKPNRLLKPPTNVPLDPSLTGMRGSLSTVPIQSFQAPPGVQIQPGLPHGSQVSQSSNLPGSFLPTTESLEFSSMSSRGRSFSERVIVGHSLPSISATSSLGPSLANIHSQQPSGSSKPEWPVPMRLSSLEMGECIITGADQCELLRKTVISVEERLKNLSQVSPDDGRYGLAKEWEMLSQYEADNCALFTTNVGQAHASKNRSVDVMPYDHNRVKIRGVAADYINASHLSMGPGCSPYIVAQAPLLETIEDFWTMVWEYDIPVIAMLTAEIEGGTVVCHRYWPEGGGHVMKLGLLSLTLLSHQENSGCVIRDIRIKNTKSDEEKKVVHLQFTSWPEIGVPQSPNALADFVVSVESSYRESSPDPNHPLLIQCSHGSGRSGVFLVLHCAIRALQIGSEAVDVPEVVQGMRRQRMRLIEDKGQYTFCYRALLHFARMCLKEAEDAAGEITPLSPTLSKKPMQAKEVTSEADPLDSINAFWKVESGALVKDIQNKNASKTEEQKAEPVVEFDPPTATFLSHYLPVSSISSVKQHPQPAVPTPRQVSVSYGSGGTVVHMLGSAIPSVLSPHAMIASATSVSTTKLDETDTGSRDVSVAPHFQLLLAQKQKQIDMQTAQLVEQERIIQELQREVTEQRVQIAEQQKLLTQKQVAVDEQKRVISDMQQRLSEQKHMEQRLEQLTEMMLLQQKDQLEHRMEERQQRQHIQQQLQHQQARLIEEERIKRQHKQPQQQPVQPLPLQNQKPDELQHKHILQELNPSPRQQQPNPQPVQQQPHSQSMQQQQPSVLQQQWPMQQQTQQPQVQTKQLQMQAQQPQMQAQQPQQQQVLSQGHKPQAMQLKQQQILDMQQRQQHPQQQQHQQIQHHQQQQQQQQIQHQQQMQQQIQQRTQQQRQLEQQHQIQQQLQHRQQAMEQPQHRILTTSQGMQGSFQPSHPQFRELPHQPTAGRQPGSQVSMEQQSREQIQQWKQVPSLQGVVQTQSVVSQPGPLLPQGGMTPVQPFQYYQKQEPQVSPGVPQLPIPHTLAGKDHLPVGSHPQQGCSPGLMQNTQRIQQHIVPRVVQPLAPGQQTLGSTNMNPVQTPSSLTPGHMQAANMAMGMHPYVQK